MSNVWRMGELIKHLNTVQGQGDDGKWRPVRPIPPRFLRWRLRAAWLVFTGKADALIWPEGDRR